MFCSRIVWQRQLRKAGLPHGFDEIVLEAWEGKDQLAADRLVYNTRFQKALFVNRDMGLGDLASRVFRFA